MKLIQQFADELPKLVISPFRHLAQEELKKPKPNRKHIDRAKAILIKSQGYSEDEAYHALRKLTMDRKISLGEMAKNVIAMAELFK